jgi:long-chain acyl-CoA synthetase
MSVGRIPRANIYGRFCEVANQSPDAQALIVDDTRYSYADLRQRIDGCASGLAKRGIQPGDAVALALPNGLDFVVASFAAFALDCFLVPLNPRFKEEELSHYLQQSRPKAILHSAALGPVLDALDIAPAVRATGVDQLGPLEPGRAYPGVESQAQTGIYMFSSGSTGKSKRVTRTQAAVLFEYEATAKTVALSAKDCILCTVPLFHAHGFGNAMLASLLSGGRLVLLTAEFNARATMSALVEHGVTIYPAVPFMFKMLADTKFATAPNLASIRLLVSAGAALPEAVSQRFLELYAKPISQLYGSTETGAITLNLREPESKPTSVGLPLAGMGVEIRGENLEPLPPLSTGEIWVTSPAATHCYDGLPELSRECFVDGAFFAGDLGHMDHDGYLYITGRKKLLINVAGYKVDPLEVEAVLSRHPNVQESVVMGVAHAGAGERIKAVVVCKDPGACSAESLIEFAAAHLAEYKVPKTVEFRTEIPRSPLGKVLRKYL